MSIFWATLVAEKIIFYFWVFGSWGNPKTVPLLIDSLITATRTFCDFFSCSCYFCLTVISRGPILRIQIRGTCTPQMRHVERLHGAFGVGRNQAGFKAKKPTRSFSSAPYFTRGICTMAAAKFTSRMAEHLPFTAVYS